LQTKRADERPEYAKNIIRCAACNVIEERRRNIDVMLDKEKDFSTDRTVFVQQCSQRHTMLECQQQLLGNVHKDEDEILTKLLKRIRVTMTRVQENLVAAVCSEIDSTKAITVDTIQSMEILLLFLEKKKNVEDRQGIACSYINTLRRKLRALNILRRDNPQDEDTITEIIGKFTEIRERLRNGPLKDIFLPNAEEEEKVNEDRSASLKHASASPKHASIDLNINEGAVEEKMEESGSQQPLGSEPLGSGSQRPQLDSGSQREAVEEYYPEKEKTKHEPIPLGPLVGHIRD